MGGTTCRVLASTGPRRCSSGFWTCADFKVVDLFNTRCLCGGRACGASWRKARNAAREVARHGTCSIWHHRAQCFARISRELFRETGVRREGGEDHAPHETDPTVVLHYRGAASGRREYAGKEAVIRRSTAANGWVDAVIGESTTRW